MTADAVKPELVYSLLVHVENVAQLVVVNLLTQHFGVVSHQLELAGKFGNFCGVRLQYDLEKCCAVTFTHEELIRHEDGSSEEGIRRLKHQLDIFHSLERAKLCLDF